MSTELDEVYLQLDEEIETARLECVNAEAALKIANAVFDRLMRLKPHIKNRLAKVKQSVEVGATTKGEESK